jgi:hypothetical protein
MAWANIVAGIGVGTLAGVGDSSLMTSILVLLFGADIVHTIPLSVLASGGHALLG